MTPLPSPPWKKLQNFCVNCYHKSKKAGEGEENSVKYPCRYQQILAVSLWSKRKPCLTCRTWVHSKQIEFDKLFIKLSLRSQMKFWNLQFFTCSHWNINTWSSSSLKFILFPTCTESPMWFIFYPYSIVRPVKLPPPSLILVRLYCNALIHAIYRWPLKMQLRSRLVTSLLPSLWGHTGVGSRAAKPCGSSTFL